MNQLADVLTATASEPTDRIDTELLKRRATQRRRRRRSALVAGGVIVTAIAVVVGFALISSDDGETSVNVADQPDASAEGLGPSIPVDIALGDYWLIAIPEGFEYVTQSSSGSESTDAPENTTSRESITLSSASGETLEITAIEAYDAARVVSDLEALPAAAEMEIVLYSTGSPRVTPAVHVPARVVDELAHIAWIAWEYGAFEVRYTTGVAEDSIATLIASIRSSPAAGADSATPECDAAHQPRTGEPGALPRRGSTDDDQVSAVFESGESQIRADFSGVTDVRIEPRNGEVWDRNDAGGVITERVNDFWIVVELSSAAACPTAPTSFNGVPLRFVVAP